VTDADPFGLFLTDVDLTKPDLTHRPTRPDWRCCYDGQEWPCQDGKRELRRHFSGQGRAFGQYLSARMNEAHDDMPETDERALLRRFVLWPGREDDW
jgi:hypothetical protein